MKNIRETFMNKVAAFMLILIGLVSARILNDSTVLVMMLLISTPLMLAKEQWVF